MYKCEEDKGGCRGDLRAFKKGERHKRVKLRLCALTLIVAFKMNVKDVLYAIGVPQEPFMTG
jgi:hypothetical protein